MTRQRISYAQNGEDVRAWRALRHVAEPFYVEVGASHPYDDSVTAALSAEGWHGLLVEAEPASAEVLRDARARDTVVAAAASDAPGVLSWSDDGVRGHGQVTRAGGGLEVPAVRVGDLLAELAPTAVHFMSVDVEGHEREALLGCDLSRWTPWVMCVEATAPNSRAQTHGSWEPIVLAAGYVLAAFDGLNRWYVAPDHLDLMDAVAEPFGVLDVMLDGWQRRDVVDLLDRLETVDAEVQRLREEHERSQREHEHVLRDREHLQHEHAHLQREHERTRRELDLAETARDAALARERVMLESKSWRLTAPLRRARSRADAALAQRALARPAPPAPPVQRAVSAADLRRQRALAAKLAAAQQRGRG